MKPSLNLKKTTNSKLVLLGAIICLIYFILLVILSIYKVDIIILGVLIELFTIPFILLLLFLTFISIKNNIKNRFNIKSNYFFSFLLLGLSIIILTIATIYD
ncbi:hypothetical protein [Flavivirga jejuensis]|uniref:Uncharacterized protein n=1 Tax=Flavivirga jejuensis TaxID=870487 RepID=A0ABT8WM92_9FLAO|nr:hypothetical protein [Flavivirga jejuensis]MDO5974265.1 hypothetical protein [Flavivirga jejuensis]